MSVDINYWGVLLAAVSSMIVGSLWYMPSTFGKLWMQLTGVKMKGKGMKPLDALGIYGSVFLASVLTAISLAYLTDLSHNVFTGSWLSDALTTAIWTWLGFTAARMFVHDTFENRPGKLTLLNAAHELVTVVVMALLIGWLHP